MALLRIFHLLALLTPVVLGGSAMWQPKVEYRPPHPPIAVEASGYAVRNEISEAVVQKRYLSFRPNAEQNLWPDKTVSYCFRNSESRSKLVGYIREATELWQTAGLHRDVYKYLEVADPGTKCVNHKDRAFILVITYNPGGGFDATVGVKPLNARKPNYKGPEMNIGDDAVGRTVSTVAHELGHVWGLYHEHQNKIFWQEPYSHEGGIAFGANFDCTAIEGYAAAMAKITSDNAQLAPRLCIDDYVAADYDFDASQWLPDRSRFRNSPWGQSEGKGELYVDLRSIMIYPSDGFAAVPGQPVLLTNAGATLFENPVPNHSDVEGIRRIYEDSFFSKHEAPTLPNSSKSIWYSKFADMFRKTKGC